MSEKMSGYTLLGAGILVMFFAVVNVVLVFTGKIKPVQIYTPPAKKSTSSVIPTSADGLSGGGIPVNLDSIFPQETMAQTINLSIHFFLMSFILGFGGKIATLGVQLIRPVYVKMKGADVDATKSPNVPPKQA